MTDAPWMIPTTRATSNFEADAGMLRFLGRMDGTSSNLPPLGTLDEIAYQMTHAFWGGESHRWNVAPGGTITVNLTGITADGRTVAREALAVWSDIIGVTFQEVTTGGQIIFDDLAIGTGAFSESAWENGFTTYATVNVSLARLGTGPGVMRVGLHTYIHEIGHALGLGHTAFANSGTAAATYPDDALWRNDGSAISVMSYFDNGENSYYADQGFSHFLVTTPQVADIIAIGNLYGLSTTTRTGDTTYGFNNNSGRLAYDSALYPNVAYTIFDSGGIDTLDYSGFWQNQLINLNPEAFSNIGPGVGNVVIARGVVIENARGGSGNDTLVGNAANNLLEGGGGADWMSGGTGIDVLVGGAGADMMTGGRGNDTFRGTAGELNGDTIADFSIGDVIAITNANAATFTFSLTGSTLNYSGGSLTLAGFSGQLAFRAAAGGGVEIYAQSAPTPAASDFDGDGRSDILWRDETGTLSQWLGQANGGFAWNLNYAVPTSFTLDATGDFNGDGHEDLLWRDASGTLSQWLGQANGSFAWNPNANYPVPTSFTLESVGDFNGDGRDDILWRDAAGTLSQWLGQANGSFAWNPNANYPVPTSLTLEAVGDFNADGRSDILWRDSDGTLSQWLGQAGGSFAWNLNYAVPTSLTLAEVGDFNGDGHDDILWRDSDGTLSQWLGQANGSFAWNLNYAVAMSFTLEGVGDFNGDGRDDILWRDAGGTLSQWLGQANGSFAWNPDSQYAVPSSWDMQPADLF